MSLFPCLQKLGNKLTADEKAAIKEEWKKVSLKGLSSEQVKAESAKVVKGFISDAEFERNNIVDAIKRSMEGKKPKVIEPPKVEPKAEPIGKPKAEPTAPVEGKYEAEVDGYGLKNKVWYDLKSGDKLFKASKISELNKKANAKYDYKLKEKDNSFGRIGDKWYKLDEKTSKISKEITDKAEIENLNKAETRNIEIAIRQTPQYKKNKIIEQFFDLKEFRKTKGNKNKVNFDKLRSLVDELKQLGVRAKIDANNNLYINNKRVRKPSERAASVKVDDVTIHDPKAKESFEKLSDKEVARQTFMAGMFGEKKFLPKRLQDLLPSGFGQKKIDQGLADIKKDAGAEQNKEAQIVRDFAKAIEDEFNENGYVKLSSGQEINRDELETLLDDFIKERKNTPTEEKLDVAINPEDDIFGEETISKVGEEESLFSGRSELQQLLDQKKHLELSLEELEREKNVDPEKRKLYSPKAQRDIDPTGRKAQIRADLIKVKKQIRKLQAKEEVKKITGQTDMFGDTYEGPEQTSLFEPKTPYNELPENVKKVFEDQISFDFTESNSKVYKTPEAKNIRFESQLKEKKDFPASYRPLKPGEFSKVNARYRKYNTLQFWQFREKIESPEDVAFIFREAENEMVENTFVLHIPKKGKPIVQHVSIGNLNSAFFDPKLVQDGINRFDTQEIYFVHNHPSGNVVSSSNDRIILKQLREAIPSHVKLHDGIIIDTRLNRYGIFSEASGGVHDKTFTKESPNKRIKGAVKLKAIQFSRQTYTDVELGDKITSPSEIAQFLTEVRFNAGRKYSVLSLNSANQVAGRFYLTNTEIGAEMADEIAVLAGRTGGVNVVLAGNRLSSTGEGNVQRLKNMLGNRRVPLLDYIAVHPDPANSFEAFTSMVERRVLEPAVKYDANKPESKKKLMFAVMKEYGQYPLNSPRLGDYRNDNLPTIQVFSRLKDLDLLNTVKDFDKKLNPLKPTDPKEAGSNFELLARITLREAERSEVGNVHEPPPEYGTGDPRLNSGIQHYKRLIEELGERADLYPQWIKAMVADYGTGIRKDGRRIWKETKEALKDKQSEMFDKPEVPKADIEKQFPLMPKSDAERVSAKIGLNPQKIAEEVNKRRKDFKEGKAGKKAIRSQIREMIFQRRTNTDLANFETLLFVDGINNSLVRGKKITPEQLETIPFLIEGTKIPEKLGRPELQEIINDPLQKKELQEIADKVQGHFDSVWEKIVKNTDNLSVSQIENYVTHIWDIPKNKVAGVTNWFATKNKFLNKRYIQTIAEGIENFGLKPKELNISNIIKIHDAMANTVIENVKFVKNLKYLTKQGVPLLLTPGKAPADWVTIEHPALMSTFYRAGKDGKPGFIEKIPYKVHPDLVTPLKVVFGSRIDNLPVRTWEKIDAVIKKTTLSISLFHHGALLETGIAKMSPWQVAKLLTTETGVKGIRDKFGGSPLIAHADETREALKYGVQFGHTLDIDVKKVQSMVEAMADKTKDIIGVKHVTKALKSFNEKWDSILWDYIHDPLKLYAFIDAKTKMPDNVNPEIYLREQAQLINDTFGGQNWDVLMVTPRQQQVFRWFSLSPDWTISTARQALAVTGFGAHDPAGKKIRAKAGAMFWLKAAFYFGGGMNLLNMYLRKQDQAEHPEYYPKDMSFMDYTMWGNTVGHKTHLFTGRYEDGSERYLRWGKQFRELPELLMDEEGVSFPRPLLKKLGGKTAPLLNASSKIMTGKSLSGYEDWDLKDKKGWDFTLGVFKVLLKTPLPFSMNTVFLRDDKQWYPTDVAMPSSKGMSKSKAIALFRKGIIMADLDYVKEIYTGAVRNNLDAFNLFKVAVASVKADGTRELLSDIKSVDDAREKLKTTKDPIEKRKLESKLNRLEKEQKSKSEGFQRLEEVDKLLENLEIGEPAKQNNSRIINRVQGRTKGRVRKR